MVYYNVSGYNNDMFLAGILSWWYGDGLSGRLKLFADRLASVGDTFSIKLLFETLFKPFKTISSDGTNSLALSDQIRAFFDKMLSRTIGAIVRIMMIFVGFIVMIIQIIINVIILMFWLIMPIIPFAGLIMTILGWTIL